MISRRPRNPKPAGLLEAARAGKGAQTRGGTPYWRARCARDRAARGARPRSATQRPRCRARVLHILSTPRGVSTLPGNGHAAARWASAMPRNRIFRAKQGTWGAARIARRRAHAKPMHFPWASGARRIWHLCFCAPRGSSPQRKRLAKMHNPMCALSQNGYGDSFDGSGRVHDNLALSPRSSCPLLSPLCSCPLAPQLFAGPPVGPFPPSPGLQS